MSKPAAKSKKPAKKPAQRTAAEFHEAARVARRTGKPPEVVRGLLDQAVFAERQVA